MKSAGLLVIAVGGKGFYCKKEIVDVYKLLNAILNNAFADSDANDDVQIVPVNGVSLRSYEEGLMLRKIDIKNGVHYKTRITLTVIINPNDATNRDVMTKLFVLIPVHNAVFRLFILIIILALRYNLSY